MLRRASVLPISVLLLLLAGCSASESTAEPRPDVSPAPTATSSPAAPPTPTLSDADSAVGQTSCAEYEAPVFVNADGGDAVAAAAADASLGSNVRLNPGVQVITSVDEPGMLKADARICSDLPLTPGELLEAGNAIAQAIYADPAHESLTLLMVSPYVPSGDYLDRDPVLEPIQTDFEMYLWDADDNLLDSNWD